MDVEKFLNSTLVSRTESIEVPELKTFFGKDKPVWVVKGLTSAELGRVNQAAESNHKNLKELVEALASEEGQAAAIRKTMGLGAKDVPADVSRRIELLTEGSVDPVLGVNRREVAVKLAESFPVVFYKLTTTILSLTGQGAELGKRKASGASKK